MNKQHLRRPRIHRAFVKWLKKNSARFAVPLRMTKIKGDFRFCFVNYPDWIFVEIFRHDLAVSVEWEGRWFDALIWPCTFPIVTRGGYKYEFDRTDSNDPSHVFPSLEAMWQKYLFEPFLGWVNDTLAPARGLQILSVKGFRQARLFREGFDFPEDGKPIFEGDPEGYFECVVPLKPYTKSKEEP
jgi:hypothetical protein